MGLWPDFLGGTYLARSPSADAETAINVYLETKRTPGGAKQAWFYGTPGLRTNATAGTVGNRGWFSQDGLVLTVVGDTLYRSADTASPVSVGTITNDKLPVSFASNGLGGNQIAIVGGGNLYVLNTVALTLSTPVMLPFADPVMIVFQDGYGLINQANTPTVWFSALEDFTSWDALDFFVRSQSSDNIVALAVTQDRVWTLGSKTLTQFYDSGDLDTPWVPYPGTTTQIGCASATLVVVSRDVVYWVATGPTHARYLVAAGTGSSPQEISTPPITRWLASATTLTTGTLFLYEQEDHPFLCATLPASTDDVKTYAYDLREQLWHARADWDAVRGVYTQWRAAGCVVVNGTVYVGDAFSGKLYVLDLDTYSNAGDVLMRERTAPYLSTENQWLFLDAVELGMQPGVGLVTGQGSDPKVELSLSRDGARTWISAGFASLGAIGQYVTRAIWRRLGRTRADRLVLRVRQSDPVKTAWGPGLYLRVTPGTGQL